MSFIPVSDLEEGARFVMRGRNGWIGWLGACLTLASIGAGPASPSYIAIEQAIAAMRANLEARPQANGPGWETFASAMERDLKDYASAPSENDRLKALGKLHAYFGSLRQVTWAPAARVRQELQTWLKPRVALAWASRRLVERVRGLPETTSEAALANRDHWVRFVGDRVGTALRDYEGAGSATQRVDALDRLRVALTDLRAGNQARPWSYSLELQKALDDLYDLPNVDAVVDLPTLTNFLSRDVVEAGPIWWKGQTTYVTPGRKTGFGLLHSDTGIAFYNSQLARNVTPISGFQEQLEADPQGQQATRLYTFAATSRDNSQVTVTTILGPNGLAIMPQTSHDVDLNVRADPAQGGNFARQLAGLFGMGRDQIQQRVREGALTRLRQQVPQNADELAAIRAAKAQEEQNARLRNVLPGDGTVRMGPMVMTQPSFRSRPDKALIGGRVGWADGPSPRGADTPRPEQFRKADPGVSADIHLPSLAGNAAEGYLTSTTARDVHNVLLVGRKGEAAAEPGAPKFDITRNADYATFFKAVEEGRANPETKGMPIRVQKPAKAPEFVPDSEGRIVAVIRDLRVEVGVPKPTGLANLVGGGARVYRIHAPKAELTLSFQIQPGEPGQPIRVLGKIESLEMGPEATVETVGESEDDTKPVSNLMRAGALAVLTSRVNNQTIDAPLNNVTIPQGFALKSVSPLDPSGWIRLVLSRG